MQIEVEDIQEGWECYCSYDEIQGECVLSDNPLMESNSYKIKVPSSGVVGDYLLELSEDMTALDQLNLGYEEPTFGNNGLVLIMESSAGELIGAMAIEREIAGHQNPQYVVNYKFSLNDIYIKKAFREQLLSEFFVAVVKQVVHQDVQAMKDYFIESKKGISSGFKAECVSERGLDVATSMMYAIDSIIYNANSELVALGCSANYHGIENEIH